MNVYTTDKIRNVVLLGHGGSGKTTLVEAMAYLSGITSRMGKVTDGNTISDYDKEEIKRQFSISTSVVPIIWEDTKINILDTPGYFGFVGEVEEAVSAADAAIIVVSGKAGIEVGTQKAWEICEKYKLPRMFFVTEMDVDNASYRQVVEDLQEMYGKRIAPFHFPIRENEKFVGYVNVVTQTANRWTDKGQVEEMAMPEYSKEYLEKYREVLMEAVAETSEEFMDRYFGGEEFSEFEIRSALRTNVVDGSIIPTSMGSSILVQGIYTLLDDIVKYLPSPEKRPCVGVNLKTNEAFEGNYDIGKPKTAYIFKTIVDPFIGRYSLIKVCSGTLKSDSVIYNYDKDTEEKISRLYIMRGKETIEVPELKAGDIGAIGKLTNTATGDTLSLKSDPLVISKMEVEAPYTYKRYEAVNKGDEDKVSQALAKMMDEDLTLRAFNDKENRQSLLYGMGDQHLDVVVSKLEAKYRVKITLSKPRIPYRETIRKKVSVREKYKKQSGGHGQYGDVAMEFEPSGDLETPYVFEERVVGGAVPKNYFPAVEKGIQESVQKGPMAGYPVVGIKATLFDGSYHPVDSSEMAFKTAARQAFKSAFLQANPVILEPIASLSVVVPDSYTGDIMGDLNKKRGRVLGMNPVEGGKTEIVADIPLSELYGYSTNLRSMTGGRGTYAYSFSRYEQAPADVQDKVVAEGSDD